MKMNYKNISNLIKVCSNLTRKTEKNQKTCNFAFSADSTQVVITKYC